MTTTSVSRTNAPGPVAVDVPHAGAPLADTAYAADPGARLIDEQLRADREALLTHPLFAAIHDVDGVRRLMQTHVFAVWDFMSLLKRLQRELTCVTLPWTPPRHATVARLINEIVVGEESDEHPGGGHASHLDLYLQAMEEIGADTSTFRHLLDALARGVPLDAALERSRASPAARAFVRHTMDVALNGSLEDVLACFFFGREDIIPDMFGRLLGDWGVDESEVPTFSHYLHRHIEMDGDDHGPAAKRLVLTLVTTPEQRQRLVQAARAALQARIRLWDGVLAELQASAPHELQPA